MKSSVSRFAQRLSNAKTRIRELQPVGKPHITGVPVLDTNLLAAFLEVFAQLVSR